VELPLDEARQRALSQCLPRHDRLPQTVKKAVGAGEALVTKVAALLVGSEEHQVQAERIGPPPLDIVVGHHHVAAALGHLGAVLDHEPMLAEASIRFLEVDVAEVFESHGDETRVQQVEDGVLLPSDVHGDGQPTLRELPLEGHVVPPRRRIPQEVPCAVQERVAHVGLPSGEATAPRARNPVPRLHSRERAHPALVGRVIVQPG